MESRVAVIMKIPNAAFDIIAIVWWIIDMAAAPDVYTPGQHLITHEAIVQSEVAVITFCVEYCRQICLTNSTRRLAGAVARAPEMGRSEPYPLAVSRPESTPRVTR